MKKQTKPKYTFVPEGTGRDSDDCIKCCFDAPKTWCCSRPIGLHSCCAGGEGNPTGKDGFYIRTSQPSPKAIKPDYVEHIKLESMPGFDKQIIFRIKKQSPEVYDQFNKHHKKNCFASKVGIYIERSVFPCFEQDIENNLCFLYVRGSDRSRDLDVTTTSKTMFKRVQAAVKEFNVYLTKLNEDNKKNKNKKKGS